jgi:poly(glycerol-phosphate) alpha-glucosyltransferase
MAPWLGKVPAGAKVLLYLGRLHPKKGLPNLIRAWNEVSGIGDLKEGASEWTLVIAGWDQGGHEEELKSLTKDLNIDQRTLFIGPLFGDERDGAYANASAFILPSFGEGVPLAVLEAWANSIPVLMTPQCNLPEGYSAKAAIRIEANPSDIAAGIHELVGLPEHSRIDMGLRGRKLVAERFNWSRIATSMHDVYGWLLGLRPKPGCVVE